MLTPERLLRSAMLGVVLLGLTTTRARGDFDPTKGKVVLDRASFVVTFDGPDSLAALAPTRLFDGGFDQIEAPAPTEWIDNELTAIEGQGALRMGSGVFAVYLSLDAAAERLRDRRAEFTIWVQPGGALPVVEVFYTARPLAEAQQFDFFAPQGRVRLQPTGRATSDGWRELSSGPVDFRMFGDVEARFIQIIDERLLEQGFLFGVPSNTDGEMLLDALSVTDAGPRAVSDVACSLLNEEDQCGVEGSCTVGRCVDAKAALGTPPPIGPVREQYLARLGYRIEMMAGARYTQAVTPQFTAALDALASEPRTSAYWTEYYRAFDALGDGHIAAPEFSSTFGRNVGFCIYQGVADMLPGARADTVLPLVFDFDPNHPAAADLRVGDVLVAVDGLPPTEWMARADRYLRYPGDPRGRDYVTTEQLPEAALATGAVLTFERCNRPSGTPCPTGFVETIEVDLAALAAGVWTRDGLNWPNSIGCDFRFRRDIFDPNVFRGQFIGARDFDNGTLRSILLNGVSPNARVDNNGTSWDEAAVQALTDLPSRVLIDERTGNGGTFEGVIRILNPFFPNNVEPLVQLVPQMRPELDPLTFEAYLNCLQAPSPLPLSPPLAASIACGNYSVLGLLVPGSFRATAANARVAIVNGRDVSGNDFLPRAFQDRPTGQTRIFGAVPTYGAFGPVYTLPRLLQENAQGRVQIQDSAFFNFNQQPNFTFETGFGVEPDEVILQTQSDAVRGVDTILEAAKAWLRQGDDS